MTNPKILIVDDEPFNVEYLVQELEEFDYEILSAVNGREALDIVHAEFPDLILLDIMMPVMDGFEVLKYLKADSSTRDISVIIISANNDLGNVVRGIQLGAEDYLPKPFEPVLLHARISSSLEKKRLRDIEHLYLKNLEDELEIGHQIQQGFLPSELPKVTGWEIAAYFEAAHEVAGDFYDSFLLPDGNLLCVVGDVCDKGVGAALFMTLFRSLIRITSTTDLFTGGEGANLLSPAERLQHVVSFTNHYIATTHFEDNMFATLFVSIFNVVDGTLSYVNCGNECPLIVRADSIVAELRPTGPVVGLFAEAKFAVREILLEKEDLLLAFTDGIPDARNSADESFGHEHLHDLLSAGSTNPEKLLERIAGQINQFIDTAKPFDDITLLAVKRIA